MADLNIGINVVAGPAKKALNDTAKATDNLSKSIVKAQGSTKKMGKQFNSTAVSTNKFAKGAMQQAGYQIADFSVQLTGGTNALQAFGQQGSQMLAVFGPVGSILGAAVAIFAAFGVVAQKSGASFLGFGRNAKTAEKATTELEQSIGGLAGTFNTEVASGIEAATKSLGKLDEQMISSLRLIRSVRMDSVLASSSERVKAFEADMKSVVRVASNLKALRDTLKGPAAGQTGAEQGQINQLTRKLEEQGKSVNNVELAYVEYLNILEELRHTNKFTSHSVNDLIKRLGALGNAFGPSGKPVIAEMLKSLQDLNVAMSGGSEGAARGGQTSVSKLANQINKLARQEVKSAERAARARKKEADERARQAVSLAAGEVQAAQAATRAREREADARKATNDARVREAKAIFEAEQKRVKSIEKAYSASLASINKETQALKLQNELFGQSEEAIKAQVDFLEISTALKEKGKNLTLEELDAIHAQLEARAEEVRKLKAKTEEQKLQAEREKATDAALKKINAEREKAQKRINQLIGDGFRTASDAIAGLISGTNTWREALTQVLRKVIDIASQMGTTKSGGFSFDKLFGAVGGLFGGGGFSPVPQAGPIGAGGLQTFHTGGVVGRDSGPIGPRSDERLIMARTGERVLNRGETMGSVAGGGVVVNQTINLSTGVQQTVRAEVMSLAPQIAAQAKAAVLDAKKRGGGFGAAFA